MTDTADVADAADAAEDPEAPTTRSAERREFDLAVERHHRRNFIGLLLWQVTHRQGWVFKTESTVISTFAMKLGASEALLGLFPAISRLGKFLPQLVAGRALEPLRRKLPASVRSSFVFGLAWLVLGAVLMNSGVRRPWSLWFFFGMYAFSWFAMGVVLVGTGTLRGKLIRPDRRGLLFGMAQMVGGALALVMLAVLHYLTSFTEKAVYWYGVAFTLSGIFFLVAFASLLVLKEPPLSSGRRDVEPVGEFLRSARELMAANADFRRAVALRFLCNVLFSCIMFYASFGRECIGQAAWDTMIAAMLVVQTISRSGCSLVTGWVADRWGNRAVMRGLSFALVLWPLVGVVMSRYATPEAPWLWAPVYLMVGVVIPLEPIAQNYILEVTPVESHAKCLGVANGALMVVAVVPLVVGVLISVLGHAPVFMGLAVLMLPAIYLSMKLGEPRFGPEPRREPPPLV